MKIISATCIAIYVLFDETIWLWNYLISARWFSVNAACLSNPKYMTGQSKLTTSGHQGRQALTTRDWVNAMGVDKGLVCIQREAGM